jgi:hypothetical protein
MAVWTEKFNHAAKASAEKNPRNHKRYAFSPYFAVSNLLHFSLPSLSHVITCFIIFYCFPNIQEKLAVETSTFDPASVMKEFKLACSKFKVLKDDMVSFRVCSCFCEQFQGFSCMYNFFIFKLSLCLYVALPAHCTSRSLDCMLHQLAVQAISHF